MKRILLTGATGYIGSHLCEKLASMGYEVMAVIRSASNIKLIKHLVPTIKIVNIDYEGWLMRASDFNPDIILHSAWNGVEAKDRDNVEIQQKNIDFMKNLFSIMNLTNVRRFISLGSQAEYGYLDRVVKEDEELKPNNEYAKTKIKAMDMLKEYCQKNKIDWYWLRVFAVKGGNQKGNWLLPLFEQALDNPEVNSFEFGSCEQRYAYLDIDLAIEYIIKVIDSKGVESGVYNLSASCARPLKDMLIELRDKKRVDFELIFNKEKDRDLQSTWIEGDMTKFFKAFGKD